ncbi:MAG TPA: FadR/GntR family transcriptional regulator [Devosia sp.]|jgi:DNA-binding FadR family transcriptional regulator|nr:FadR/GntR family transcriptional regulator [Devosia sp.]
MTASTSRPRTKLSARIVETLRQDLLGGAIAAGHRLPTESQLTTQFGVSRTVVREAIAALAADGLVESRQGSGVFATRHLSSTVGAIASEMGRRVSSALNVLEVRLAIEVESAALAAQRHSPSQEAAIQEAFFEFERLLRLDQPTGTADLAFHRAIAAATGNPSYLDVLEALGRNAIPCDVASPESTEFVQDRDYQTRLQAEHLAILKAISARDADGARRAMRQHLGNSQARYRKRLHERQANYATSITEQD